MAEIHPSAILEGDVQLDGDVVVGPHCVLTGPISIGAGTRLIGNVYLQGPLRMGAGNVLYPFVCLGFAPQHLKYDPDHPGQGLVIGDGNTFREHASVHRAFQDDGPTTVGDRNLFMVGSHAGHDCRIGSHCVFANGAQIAGHVVIDDHVTAGGLSAVHQFCHIGRGCMLSGEMGVGRDLPPFFVLTGHNVCGTVNLVGMRRQGMSREDIDDVRWVHRTLCRSNLSLTHAVEALEERSFRPMVAEYIEFIRSSGRGICSARPNAMRTVEAD